MPVYNGERYLKESIDSVLNQTYQNLELVAIDDGSTDNSNKILASYAEKEKRVRRLSQRNAGQAKARNTGIQASQGEYIAFLDQDDLWVRDKLALQVKAISENKVDVVYSSGFVFDEDNVEDETRAFAVLLGRHEAAEMLRQLFALNRIPVLSVLLKKNVMTNVGLIDESQEIANCDDYDLWLRLAEAGASFLGMPDKLVRYRRHSNQASKDKIKSLKAEVVVLEKYRHNDQVSEFEKYIRYQTIYNDLISALIENNNFTEAKEYLYRQFNNNKRSFMALLHRIALRFLPGEYKTISYYLFRLKVKIG